MSSSQVHPVHCSFDGDDAAASQPAFETSKAAAKSAMGTNPNNRCKCNAIVWREMNAMGTSKSNKRYFSWRFLVNFLQYNLFYSGTLVAKTLMHGELASLY